MCHVRWPSHPNSRTMLLQQTKYAHHSLISPPEWRVWLLVKFPPFSHPSSLPHRLEKASWTEPVRALEPCYKLITGKVRTLFSDLCLKRFCSFQLGLGSAIVCIKKVLLHGQAIIKSLSLASAAISTVKTSRYNFSVKNLYQNPATPLSPPPAGFSSVYSS